METGLTSVNHWNTSQKLLFRFFASYFFLYIFPFPIGYVPFTSTISEWLAGLWDPLVYWTGAHVFNIGYNMEVAFNGSGDTTYAYVQLFLVAVLALIIAIVWTIADRKRKRYDVLLYWVMVFVRYCLGFTMISYGFYKVIKTQFPFPYYHLTQTYAESSPMGLLWNFMGYSTAYNVFTGAAELIGGLLLLWRRTTTFGSLVLITVLSNVVVLNFCFDVPVKIYSTNLLLMAIFILAPDIQRVVNFFFRNKAVPAVNFQPRFSKRWMRITWLSVKALLVISVVYTTASDVWDGYKLYGDDAVKKMPLFGIYNVELFVKNKDTLPPLLTDTLQWKQVNVPSQRGVTIRKMNDSLQRYNYKLDTVKHALALTDKGDSLNKAELSFFYRDSLHLVLMGTLRKDSVYIVMKKVDVEKTLLLGRGFHWINEFPFNR